MTNHELHTYRMNILERTFNLFLELLNNHSGCARDSYLTLSNNYCEADNNPTESRGYGGGGMPAIGEGGRVLYMPAPQNFSCS